jgi:hypothetical protein
VRSVHRLAAALRGIAFGGGLLACGFLSACGEEGAGFGAARLREPPAAPRRLRVLDPGGRIALIPTETFARGEDGKLEEVRSLDRLAAGSELLVTAGGCRIERARVVDAGDTIVRLRPGIPVRVRVRWDGVLPEGAGSTGLHLKCKKPQREEWAEGLPMPKSIGSEALDDDLPAPRDFTPMLGRDPSVLLYVPEPGTYVVNWTVDGANWRSGTEDRTTFEVVDDGTELAVERAFPASWAAETTRNMLARRKR